MGVRLRVDLGEPSELNALSDSGLKDGIMAMQKLDLNDPLQSAQAQKMLESMLPKIKETTVDKLAEGQSLGVLSYTDAKSGQTIVAGDMHGGSAIASLNTAINGFNKQNAPVPAAQPAIQPQKLSIN